MAEFDRPGGAGQSEEGTNLLVPADTIVVLVGARALLGEFTHVSTGRPTLTWPRAAGERITPPKLDLAGMQGTGWTLAGTAGPPRPPPPAAPPVPTIPPATIRTGTVLSTVGSGPGGPAVFTVNDAE